jgi:20S proteasome subunit alpha 2
MEIEDAVHTAILTLKEGMEGLLSESMIEIGIAQIVPTINRDGQMVNKEVFRTLSETEIKDYLANIV